MPASLRYLVRKHGRRLFEGLYAGLAVPPTQIDAGRVMAETDKISTLVKDRARFDRVVWQMGFVSGLVANHANPSLSANRTVRAGFAYNLNAKLERCLFVFEGHDFSANQGQRLRDNLDKLGRDAVAQGELLEKKYLEVDNNHRFLFDERSAVFGVCSVYFSNVARFSAHLWLYAWRKANGDQTRTPFREKRAVR